MAIKTILTPGEIRRMIDRASNLRDKVILSFYSDTGCRASELLKITVDDVDLENRTVRIPHLKRGIKKRCPKCSRSAGRSTKFCAGCGTNLSRVVAEGIEERSRLISIGNETAELLSEYIAHLRPASKIITLSRQAIHDVVRKAGRSIGLKGKVLLNPETGKKHYIHPHSFRDSLAVSWLDIAGDNANMQKALQEHLGHKSFNTTMHYNKLTPESVRRTSDEVRQLRFAKADEEEKKDV